MKRSVNFRLSSASQKRLCLSSLLKFNYIHGYSRASIRRPPFIKQPLSKVPNYLPVNCCIRYLFSTATSLKWPRPTFCCCKFSIDCFVIQLFLPPLSGQQIIYSSEMTDNMKVITTRTVIKSPILVTTPSSTTANNSDGLF